MGYLNLLYGSCNLSIKQPDNQRLETEVFFKFFFIPYPMIRDCHCHETSNSSESCFTDNLLSESIKWLVRGWLIENAHWANYHSQYSISSSPSSSSPLFSSSFIFLLSNGIIQFVSNRLIHERRVHKIWFHRGTILHVFFIFCTSTAPDLPNGG